MMSEKDKDYFKIAQTLSDVWDVLTDEERQLVVCHAHIKKVQKNDVIFQEGETPSCLYCLYKGKVKIYKEGVGGRQQIVRMVKPKEFFGYQASFVGENYVTEAAAFEESSVLCIPLDVAKKIISRNQAVTIYFVRQLAFHLGKADEHTVNLTQKHIRGRLAEALFRLKNSFGTADDGQTLAITASREDLANLSNMTTSNAIRTLSAFAQEGLVKINGRRITILDEQQLKTIATNG